MAMNMDAMLRIKADVQGENNIRRLGNSMQGLQGQVKNAALGFNSLKGAVAGFGAAIAGSAIVGGLSAVVKKAIDAGDELFNMQAKTGIAANALIGIGNAAKLADVDIATLGKGLTKLNVNLLKAAEGNEDLARKFQALGVSVKDSNGQVVPADKALKQIADRFADMPDGAQKAAAAVALFGKSGADLIPLLNEGAASMEKFTYKVGEDFAARSDLFNDTITEFGIKTQGFGMELTDALLPALQSILEVFGDLFDTKQDWTALFEVIKFGLRAVATVLYATIKLVDQFVKTIVYTFDAIGKALKGDFSAAGEALSKGFGSGLEQAKRDFAQIQKLWTDAPSPGTGRRTGGRSMALDTTATDARNQAAAARSSAEAKRAASEQERLLERRQELTRRAADLQQQLRNSIEDVNAAYKGVGATLVDQLFLQQIEAITESNRQVNKLTRDVAELALEVKKAGGQLDIKMFKDLVNDLSDANAQLANKQYQQGLKDLLPSLDEYDAKIKEVQQGKTELSEVEKLNAQINLLQLDILAKTNPELAKYVDLLRNRAQALDDATAKQKKDSESIGTGIRDRLQEYYNSVKDLGTAIGDAVVSGLKGLEDQLTAFVTTGKANFKELAASILSDLARIALRAAIIQPIVKALGGLFPSFKFANGGIMTDDGPMPLKKYATGGIANSPQLAMFGEGSMPEAYVPLPDGRRIPVAMQGGSGTTNVTVNVDASGTTASGNAGVANALGRDLAAVVDSRLVYHKRPGGLLA
jgi:lambda family phage tail tape measure protein